MITYLSTNYTAVIRSQERWDEAGGALTNFEPNEAGIKVMQDDPIGTGPYRFAERAAAQYIRYEGLDYQHWRITPEFPELQIFFVPESSTRLAMLATEEVHAAEIPRDLQAGALARGMEVVTGTTPSIRLVGFFGGNYLPSRPEYDPDAPLTNAKVREAMNRAINRQEINQVFLGGRSELMMQTHSHPKFPGWEPSWPERFPDAYGYDPERARELLAEAGYPNGFTITQHAYPRPGLPEMLDIGELVNSYWKDIGIDVKFEPIEVATQTALRRGYQTGNTVWLHTGSFTEPTRAIFVYHYDPGRFHGYDDEFFFQKYQELEVAGTAEERDRLIREMGEHCFEIYCDIPLFWIPYEFMVNPKVIAEWKTPGVFSARDFEYIKAAR
jgi:peptide/nickel transport system substrate-binding protein